MTIFGIYELTEAVRKLRHEIEMDREERLKERFDRLDAAGIPSMSRAEAMGYSRNQPMPNWVKNAQQSGQPYDPPVTIRQSEWDKMHDTMKKVRTELEGARTAKLEMESLTHSLRAERDKLLSALDNMEATHKRMIHEVRAERDTHIARSGELESQNLRLAGRVNDLELQLKAALDGKADTGTAQGKAAQEEGVVSSGNAQAPAEAGK